MSTNHTQGPWKVDANSMGSVVTIAGPDGRPIARMIDDPEQANARLIAAAPDLLEALRVCEGNIASLLASNHPAVFGKWLDSVRAAIAKATEGAPLNAADRILSTIRQRGQA